MVLRSSSKTSVKSIIIMSKSSAMLKRNRRLLKSLKLLMINSFSQTDVVRPLPILSIVILCNITVIIVNYSALIR